MRILIIAICSWQPLGADTRSRCVDEWKETCIRKSDHAPSKFLPNIGRLVADVIEGKMPPELVKKFAVNRVHEHDATEPEVRMDPPAELVIDELCTPEDLLAA